MGDSILTDLVGLFSLLTVIFLTRIFDRLSRPAGLLMLVDQYSRNKQLDADE